MDHISHPKGSNSCKTYNIIINKCQRKRKCHQEWTLATLDTQDTGRGQTKQKQNTTQKTKKRETWNVQIVY